MVFSNMSHQDPECGESMFYCSLVSINHVTSIFQIIISIAVPISIWKHRDVDGFSINFQFLFALALAFKYLDDLTVEHLEISDIFDSIFEVQLKAKRFILAMMMITLSVTVCYAKYDKFDTWWNIGAIVVSLIFALDDLNLHLTAMNRWIIGSFMDIIAWITLFNTFGRNKPFITEFYFFFMFLDHVLKILHASYDNYRDQLYGNVGNNLDLVKIFLYCYFAVWYVRDYSKMRNKVTNANVVSEVSFESSEPSVRDSTERFLKKLIYSIENEKSTSNENEPGLFSPN